MLAVLFAGAFVMGCAEMLVVGLIDLIAADLQVSVPAAGALVTANALGLAIGGPLLTFLTTRFDRRRVLLATMVVFVLANLLPAFGADYSIFLAARVVIGAAQGLFIAAAMVTATSIVPPERAGRAMAVVITGFASASALGLPLGTLLGQAVGWRGSFTAVVAVALVILIIAARVLPSVPTPRESGAVGQARFAFAPRVLAVLGLAALIFVAIQSAVTYLVPFLAEVTDVSGPAVGAYLLAYGVATTVGSFVGGRFADANATRALIVGATGATVSLDRPVQLRRQPAGRRHRGDRHRDVRHGDGAVAPAPGREPRRARRTARSLAAGIRCERRNRRRSVRRGTGDRPRRVPAAVLTGAAVGAISIVAAWATGFLKPAAVAAPEPVATH